MFGHRFAFGYQGGPHDEWEDDPCNKHGRHGHGPHGRFFGMGMKRGPFGPGPFGRHGGPFGPKGPFGPGGPIGPEGPFEGRRYFGRGDVKFALLELLQERPMHGYEMMKALEERTGGFYSPSAGTIYPTLQMLEDRGLVTVQEVEGKKVYSITDTGRAFLQERQQSEPTPPWERGFQAGRRWWHEPEAQALRAEATEVARLFAIATRKTFQDPQKLGQLREILSRTRHDLSALIYDGSQQESATSASDSNGTTAQEPPQA